MSAEFITFYHFYGDLWTYNLIHNDASRCYHIDRVSVPR